MNKSLKVAASVLAASLAFAWHIGRQPDSRIEVQANSKLVLNLDTRVHPKAPSAPQIRLPSGSQKSLPKASGSAKGNECPKENYHEIMNYYQKSSWQTCVDMSSKILLANTNVGSEAFFLAEIERMSSPLIADRQQHRFRVTLKSLTRDDPSESGVLLYNDIVDTEWPHFYSSNLKEQLPAGLHEELESTWEQRSDIDSLCFNPETREYARLLTGTLTHSSGRFLARTEINLSKGGRMQVVCQDVNNCRCTQSKIKMRMR